MRASRVIHTVESHTEGMPTRVVTGGVGTIPGATMAERRAHVIAHMDDLRTFLMCEPRGHAAMSGAILQPPTRDDCDVGVVYIEVSGCLPMCGHGTMGVATTLVETGAVAVTEPETVIRLDTPAGLVTARVAVSDGRAESVTIRNVASYLHAADLAVDVAGIGPVTLDIAYGGNFYAIVDAQALGVEVSRRCTDDLLRAGSAVMDAVEATARPTHPLDDQIAGCHHVQIVAAGSDATTSRHAMVIHPGWFDRSPCGTGTSARVAQLHARGELATGATFTNTSLIDSRFTARVVEETTVADHPAVVPEVTGRAWITGTAVHTLDPADPFPAGFTLAERDTSGPSGG